MSSTTNTAINSRSINGIITITDGEATLENGNLDCNDIVSDTLTTTNLISTIFTCNGEIRSNLVGPYTIPVSTSALTGSLISYGNTSNSGATDFTNYGSTYNLLKQGFYFNNINSTTTLTNLAIIDNSQTYFKSQLVGCTAETPLNTTSIVNKTYVDSNFVDRSNNLTQDINGDKTFTNDLTIFKSTGPNLTLKQGVSNYSDIRFGGTTLSINTQNTAGTIVFETNRGTRATLSSTQLLLSSGTFLTTNDMKSRAPASAHTLLSDISTGTLAISSATATNTINGATQLNQQATFNNFTPICSVASPIDANHLTRKDYCDNTFLDRVNNLAQNINGLKTFTNNTNITASLLARTNIKLSEYENSPTSNNVILTFPMPETIALRTTPGTTNAMTVTLPTLSNNERGYVFTFNKLFDTTNNLNFNVTFNTSSGQGIYTLLDQSGTPTSNTTLLSIDKIQCKLAVGFFGSFLYWIEQTDFSTFDRFKLREWQNATQTNSLTLSFPLPPTIALRANTATTMTITLPTLTTNDRGKIFTFVKVNTFKFDVTFNTSSSQWIFPLNNLTGTPTTNSTIFPSNKVTTRLAVGWVSSFTYWIEVSDYSTFDVDTNNGRYVDFTSAQSISGAKSFNTSLPTSTLVPNSPYQLVNKIYTDTNFQLISNMNNYVNITDPQNVAGVKTFSSLPLCSVVPSTADQLVNKNYTDTNFQLISNMSNYLTTTAAASTYLTQSNASSTYLTTTTAASTYLTQTNAASTYLTQTNAATTYASLTNSNTFTNYLISNSEAFFNSWVNLKFRTRIYDLNLPKTNYTQLYMIGSEFMIAPESNGNFISFYCKDAALGQLQTFKSSALGNTSFVPFTANAQATFNNNAPVSNTPPTLPSHLTTKSYVDSMPVHNILNSTNAWTGFNSFDTNLPTSTITATTANQLVNFTTLTTQGYTTLPLVQGNANTFTNTNAFTGDVTLSKTKNNSSYATYNALGSTYIGYMTEVPAGTYIGIGSETRYQLGAITLNSTNVGFWTCNYEVEINCSTAGSISKIYVFVSNNNVSQTVPIGLPGAKANNFSTQTYAVGDSTYHSGSFSFLQSTTSVIYAVQLIAIVSSGGFQCKGQIRMLRIL